MSCSPWSPQSGRPTSEERSRLHDHLNNWGSSDASDTDQELARQQFHAHPDQTLVPAAVEILRDKPTDWQVECLYSMIGSILLRFGDSGGALFISEQLPTIKKKRLKAYALEQLRWGTTRGISLSDATNILPHAGDQEKMHGLQQSAVRALGVFGGDPRAEGLLIKKLSDWPQSGWVFFYAIEALSYVATSRSLPSVIRILENPALLRVANRKKEIVTLAAKILVNVAGADELLRFRELVAHPISSVSRQAMRGILKRGDESDVPRVQQRIRQLLRKKNRRLPHLHRLTKPDIGDVLHCNVEGDDAVLTEVFYGLLFLNNRNVLASDKVTLLALSKNWSRLTETEKQIAEPLLWSEQSTDG